MANRYKGKKNALRVYVLPLMALMGMLFGLWTVYWTQKEVPVPPILFPPPQSPYGHAIAASGIIEASSQNIAIGTPFSEIVEQVFIVGGADVKKGDPLFKLDTRSFEAARDTAKSTLDQARAVMEDKKEQYSFYTRLKDRTAVSELAYKQAYYALKNAEEAVKVAEGTLAQRETDIERSTVRAPMDGKILQANVRVGEIAPIIPVISNRASWQTAANGTLVLMGEVLPLQVRIDIDEEDAWRFESGARATAFVRGNSRINFPMTFQRIEPYIVPKSSFTGATTERVDTRVLQVLYNFEKGLLPIYAGQILDVYIEAGPAHEILP
jgi:HlyD family secretion protein